MLKFKSVIFCLLSYFCVKSVHAAYNDNLINNGYNNPNSFVYSSLYKNGGYYYFQNNSILNLAPTIGFNGLTNRELKFAIDGIDANFLNLPFNSTTFINSFFISKVEATSSSSASSSDFFGDYININTVNANDFINQSQSNGVVINSSISNPNFITNNSLIGYFKTDNTNFILGVNYFYLKNSFNSYKEDSNNLNPLDNYSNIVAFEYAPLDKDISFKITNINFLSNARKNISNNKEAQAYFENNILKQKSLGNILNFSYESNPKDNPLWHYSSSLSFSSQKFIFNQGSSVVTSPQIDYEGINYKAQNVSNIDFMSNHLAITYGVNLSREVTRNNAYNNKTLWPKGTEGNYQLYLNSDINLLNYNKVHIISGVLLNSSEYKASGFALYNDHNIAPSLELQIIPMKGIKFYGAYLYKERLPHIYEKYIEGGYFYNDHLIQFTHNYDLKEEKSNQFKGGIALNLNFNQENIKLSADVSTFYYRIGNYIDYNFISKNRVQFSNITRATLQGYNANIKANIYGWQNQITYTFVKGIDENGNNLNNLFPSSLVLDSSYSIPFINLKPGVRARFFNHFNSFNSNYPFTNEKLAGYSLFDTYLEYSAFNNKLYLQVGIENIFNKKYQIPYTSNIYQDRTYFFNFTLKM